MHEWFRQVIDFIAQASLARAIVLSMIGGSALTQWVKFQFPEWLSDANHTRYVRTFSSLFTMTLCIIIGAGSGPVDVLLAISVINGLLCPTLYWLTVKALYHFYPWTETVLSARPTDKSEN